MDRPNNYCPVVGTCPHKPKIRPNSYFLIQPFDSEKKNREDAIEAALKKFHAGEKYEIKKSDKKIYERGIYCDICYKMMESECCIADISGESYKVVDGGALKSKIFLRPNVALELGMAYGLRKPALILFRNVNGMNQIPSDIEFVRYIEIPPIGIKGWPGASQKILDQLREREIIRPIIDSPEAQLIESINNTERDLMNLKYLKRMQGTSASDSFKINQILNKYGRLIGIIENAYNLKSGIYFNIYIINHGIEDFAGTCKVYHTRPDGIAQVEVYLESPYFEDIIKSIYENGKFVPDNHRLELFIPECVKQIELSEIESISNKLEKIK